VGIGRPIDLEVIGASDRNGGTTGSDEITTGFSHIPLPYARGYWHTLAAFSPFQARQID
jgi:hypothetical protein